MERLRELSSCAAASSSPGSGEGSLTADCIAAAMISGRREIQTRSRHGRGCGLAEAVQSEQMRRRHKFVTRVMHASPALACTHSLTAFTVATHGLRDFLMLRVLPVHLPSPRLSRLYTSTTTFNMNRPRNRQPRQNQQQRPSKPNNFQQSRRSNHPRQPTTGVPGMSQVLAGAKVSIVLKADQATGREVQGTVQDVLTRGDHPRGIKVRLMDGRVGRVQRMVEAGSGEGEERWPASRSTSPVGGVQVRDLRGQERGRAGDAGGMPPPRTLTDFIPEGYDGPPAESPAPEKLTFASAKAICPICGLFEGDEVAVSHHVQSHLD